MKKVEEIKRSYEDWLKEVEKIWKIDWWSEAGKIATVLKYTPISSGKSPLGVKEMNPAYSAGFDEMSEKFRAGSEMLYDRLYESAVEMIKSIDYGIEDVKVFLREATAFKTQHWFSQTGFFLSALINGLEEELITLEIPDFGGGRQIEGLGYKNEKKLILIVGSIIENVGHRQSGEIVVKGNVLGEVGYKNKGKIVIEGDVGGLMDGIGLPWYEQGAGSVGDMMEKGEIWLNGKGAVSPFIGGGKIYRKEKQVYPRVSLIGKLFGQNRPK